MLNSVAAANADANQGTINAARLSMHSQSPVQQSAVQRTKYPRARISRAVDRRPCGKRPLRATCQNPGRVTLLLCSIGTFQPCAYAFVSRNEDYVMQIKGKGRKLSC
jgi:hypothetical protein